MAALSGTKAYVIEGIIEISERLCALEAELFGERIETCDNIDLSTLDCFDVEEYQMPDGETVTQHIGGEPYVRPA